MPVDILVGLQWGDEGKGKIIDILSPDYDFIARFQGGPNAGHTLVIGNKKFIFHTLPSGVVHSSTHNILGSGMVIDPITLKEEIETLKKEKIFVEDRIFISKNAHLILPTHKLLDAFYEKNRANGKIGSTLRGIGPAYQDKIARKGCRMADVLKKDFTGKYASLKKEHLKLLDEKIVFDEKQWMDAIKFLKHLKIIDTELLLNKKLAEGANVLAEGAQGTFLDINFGTYPYVTSSNTISTASCVNLGISPKEIRKIFGVCKAYATRVGEGPFITEQSNIIGEKLMQTGNEFGSTTGRPRRCGWLDLVALRYSIMLNSIDSLIITKADVLNCLDTIQLCTAYKTENGEILKCSDHSDLEGVTLEYNSFESWDIDISDLKKFDDLPANLKNYISFIESETGIEVSMISVGPERNQTIKKGNHN